MDKNDSPAGNDRAQASPNQHSDASAHALRSDAAFNQVGDASGNHAWSQMSGQSLKGGAGGGDATSQDGAHHNSINFADHGDIYSGAAGADGKGHDKAGVGAAGSEKAGDVGSPPSSKGDGGKSGGASSADAGQYKGPSGTSSISDAGGYQPNQGKQGDQPGDRQASSLSDTQGDRQSDARPAEAKAENYGVPDTQLPSAEQVKNGSLQDLQKQAADSRKATEDYVSSQGKAIPTLAFHGTSQKNSDNMTTERNPAGEIFIAGLHGGQRAEGASRHTDGLRDASQESRRFADNPKTEGTPGPVHVYNADNQPEAWNKTLNHNPKTDFGMLDLKNAQMIGKVTREQLDTTAAAGKEVAHALNNKYGPQHDSLTQEQKADIGARGNAYDSMRSDRELQMHLNEVARYNKERGVEAQPKAERPPSQAQESNGKGSGWSRFLNRFRSGE